MVLAGSHVPIEKWQPDAMSECEVRLGWRITAKMQLYEARDRVSSFALRTEPPLNTRHKCVMANVPRVDDPTEQASVPRSLKAHRCRSTGTRIGIAAVPEASRLQ